MSKVFKDGSGDMLTVASQRTAGRVAVVSACADGYSICRDVWYTPQEARKLARYLLKVADKIEAGAR